MIFDGEYFRTKKKRYKEIVFFVHFYGGSKRAIKRHIDFVVESGFDAFAFNLKTPKKPTDFMQIQKLRLGLKHYYSLQIEELLNEISEDKIVYSFSNPTAAAIEALSRRQCRDVKALICDSGPSARFLTSAFNLFTKEKKWGLPLGVAATAAMGFAWKPRLKTHFFEDLQKFPSHFPILSIRGWKDPLIPPGHIDEVFEPHHQLDWQKLSLPQAEHLNGLRDFPDEYRDPVRTFLERAASPLKSE